MTTEQLINQMNLCRPSNDELRDKLQLKLAEFKTLQLDLGSQSDLALVVLQQDIENIIHQLAARRKKVSE